MLFSSQTGLSSVFKITPPPPSNRRASLNNLQTLMVMNSKCYQTKMFEKSIKKSIIDISKKLVIVTEKFCIQRMNNNYIEQYLIFLR